MAGEWINKGGQIVGINIDVVEKHYGGVYVADLCMKLPSGNWSDDPVATFWCEKPAKPEYSNYFGILVREGSPRICNASTAVEGIFQAVVAVSGEIIFSRYRHDYRVSADDTAMADGGRDYFRGRGKRTFLKVEGPDFRIATADELKRETT